MTVTAQQLEKALTVLDQVVAAVNIGRGSMTATYGHRTSTGSQEHAPLPVDVDLIDKKAAAHRLLMDRALKIAMETDQPLTGRDVHSLSNYLFARAPWIVAQLWGLDFYKAVVEHTNGLEVSKQRHEPKVFAGICTCGTELYARKGQPEARCATCTRTYEVLAWREFANEFKNEHIATPPELSRLLSTPRYGYEVSTANIRMWANRDKLQRANPETNEQGEPIPPAYKLGDILNLVTERHRIKPIEGRTA